VTTDAILLRERINWPITTILALLHIGAIAALFMFSWKSLAVAAVLYWVAMGLGISMSYHRLLTHRSYKVPKAIEYFLAVCGTLALEGGPITWTAVHRLHHQKSDQPGDPHSPRDGGWWSHILWLVYCEPNRTRLPKLMRYVPDLAKVKFYAVLNQYFWVPSVVVGIILLIIGGIPLFLWAGCLRTVFSFHATWLVNSATHMWGGRRFETRDDSRNNWWVALLSFGEGWHNNHHAHPTSARHGLTWYEVDFSWIVIKTLKMFGLAKAVRVAKVSSAVVEREAA